MQQRPLVLAITLLATLFNPALSDAAQTVEPPANGKPHIALLLPLKSDSFGPAAEAVRRGFMAAIEMQAALAATVYPTDDRVEAILDAYRHALQQGSKIIVGPLTKNAVTALAESGQVAVPTLALNAPDKVIDAMPSNLYLFGLSVEAEARQLARMAKADGKKTALTVTSATALAKRMQSSFLEEWRKLGGEITAELSFSAASVHFPELREAVAAHPADMIFLAADAPEARLVRPYLDAAIATYATSQIYDGSEPQMNIDLNGITFMDMPWLLQPDHPAVMVYPRLDAGATAELERLYALGIDAGRLALLLQKPLPRNTAVLDGVTGRISLDFERQFVRELMPAQFQQGGAIVLEAAP